MIQSYIQKALDHAKNADTDIIDTIFAMLSLRA
jgi:hypothetical protein